MNKMLDLKSNMSEVFYLRPNVSGSEILRITPEGQLIWADDADALIENGEFSGAPWMQQVLRVIRTLDKDNQELRTKQDSLEAENARLRQALKIISGVSPAIDNLMSDKDIARAALEAAPATQPPAKEPPNA